MLLGTTGHTSCPETRPSAITSTNTTGFGAMPPGKHLCARRTGPMNLRWFRRTAKYVEPLYCSHTIVSAVTTIRSKLSCSTRTQAQNPVPSNTTSCPRSALPTT